MSIADQEYSKLVKRIHEEGTWDTNGTVRPKYADGEPAHTKELFGVQVEFSDDTLPIITSKKVPFKTAFTEMFLFWILQTTDARDFEKYKCPIWREWYKEIDGIYGIGRSYAYQLKKYNQVERLLDELKNNPNSRRHLVSYWNEADKPFKALQECAWAMQFNVRNDKLDMILLQRSVDIALGLPFNWVGYNMIQRLIARHLGLKTGRLIHQMGSVHYYDRHEETLLNQIELPTYNQPYVSFNPDKTDFFSFTPSDVQLLGYHNNSKIEYEVGI